MKIVFKRILAYMIDILLVSLVSTLITSNSYINKDYKKYNEVYKKYEVVYDEYNESKENLQEKLEDKKISQKEYDKEEKKLNTSFDKENINYNYKLIKLSVIPTTISILVILLYFVVIQYCFNGQTLGKWIMKLRVVSNNKKKLNMLNFLIRSLILNGVLINSLSVILIILLSKNNYLVYNEIIYVVNYVLEMAIIFMMAFDKNNRSVHDYIANTKVICEGEKNEV